MQEVCPEPHEFSSVLRLPSGSGALGWRVGGVLSADLNQGERGVHGPGGRALRQATTCAQVRTAQEAAGGGRSQCGEDPG